MIIQILKDTRKWLWLRLCYYYRSLHLLLILQI